MGTCEGIPKPVASGIPECRTSDHFGCSFSANGDYNGDGVTDLLIGGCGNPGSPAVVNEVWVYDGANPLSPHFSIQGNGLTDLFGGAVSFVPDVNGDGRDEIAIGAPAWPANASPGSEVGRVYVLFGVPTAQVPIGTRIDAQSCADLVLEGTITGGHLGSSLAVGDVDGNGTEDLLVGSPGSVLGDTTNYQGTVFVFDSATLAAGPVMIGIYNPCEPPAILLDTSAPLQVYVQGSAGGGPDRFGHSIAVMDDLDGIPGAEFAIGAPQTPFTPGMGTPVTTGNGFVEIHNGLNGSLFAVVPDPSADPATQPDLQDGEGFGWALAVGKLDVSGARELVVGSPFWDDAPAGDCGRVWAFDGDSLGGTLLLKLGTNLVTDITGAPGQGFFGNALDMGGDIDGFSGLGEEFLDDIAIGAFREGVDGFECPGGDHVGGRLGGAVYIVGATSPNPRFRILSDDPRDRIGLAVLVYDQDGDGRGDVVSGGESYSTHDGGDNDTEVGRVYLFKGTTLEALVGGP